MKTGKRGKYKTKQNYELTYAHRLTPALRDEICEAREGRCFQCRCQEFCKEHGGKE